MHTIPDIGFLLISDKIFISYTVHLQKTNIYNYSRKERGETRIHDEEWQKIANALDVPVEEIKEEKHSGIVHNDNSTLHDRSGSYIHNYNIPNSIVENLQDYISILKKEIENLKEENTALKAEK
ncbi:helix-turn-helix domain-containing protein [Chryseobacterium sp. PBS4-4]|uniref:Helix-turn-helix domain-containing protein n=1 Tax=Chryseobacterium edaphi TaxID=2976532 RepID=A0ABT2W7P1_9FLAO|nr:helix-turn-helix transcriptional regulator [Chryseobacterium edaphi]MCU7617419.1 helix-turn-helix domain-containing protein [Chryseobacterium edaphi]